MRRLPDSFDRHVVAAIDARLDGIEREHGVVLPLAVESGSRAWGFPSPDSDYDCRFLFVRRPEEYLGLWSRRDVIETPLDEVLDVNGWDLRKALQLMVKGNAVVLEWLRSPVVYRGAEDFVAGCLELAQEVTDRPAVARHYVHIGLRQLHRANGEPSLKRAFYALRPALVLRWMRVHPGAAVPPMALATLVVESDLDAAERALITQLVELKARTREARRAAVPDGIGLIVGRELVEEPWMHTVRPEDERARVRARAEAFFLAALDRYVSRAA